MNLADSIVFAPDFVEETKHGTPKSGKQVMVQVGLFHQRQLPRANADDSRGIRLGVHWQPDEAGAGKGSIDQSLEIGFFWLRLMSCHALRFPLHCCSWVSFGLSSFDFP